MSEAYLAIFCQRLSSLHNVPDVSAVFAGHALYRLGVDSSPFDHKMVQQTAQKFVGNRKQHDTIANSAAESK